MTPRIEIGRKVALTTRVVIVASLAAGVACAAQRGTSITPEDAGLAGTAWRLVKFQGSDGLTLMPDDRGKYTIEFGDSGQFTARVDCNRGRGTWTSEGPNQVQFGALALTRALCPPGSLHDQIVRQWGNVRSFVIRDRHLFLALIADGGIYELEPVDRTTP